MTKKETNKFSNLNYVNIDEVTNLPSDSPLEGWLKEHRKTCAVVCRGDVWFSDAYSLGLVKK